MDTEPVRNANGIALAVQGAVLALLTAAASLGWIAINPEQMGAIDKALAAVLGLAVLIVPPLVATVWARGKVTPTAKLIPGATVQTATGQPAVLLSAAEAQQLGIGPDGAL